MNFWQNLPQPFSILAPMEDVTDIVFRKVVATAARPDVFFTEFTNAASYCSEKGNFSTRGRLTFDADEQPIVAQIWGTNPEHFRQMAQGLAEQGFAGIDINMGCPAKDVVKIGAGSGMIGNYELAGELIHAAGESGLPISVKTRLGRSNLAEMTDWISALLANNIANLTVHMRTRKEMSKVDAHFELIPELVKLRNQIAPDTKLTINGDIMDYQHGIELIEKYSGVDGFMIGRGVFKNVFCFEHDRVEHSQAELTDLFLTHLDLYDRYKQIMPDERPELVRNYDSLKHFFKIYVSGLPGAAEVRAKLYDCKTTDEARAVIESDLRPLEKLG